MDEPIETMELARRFLRVLEVLGRLTHYQMPEHLQGQLAINHFKALHILHHRPGMAQKELAECMRVTPAAVSNAVQHMENLGLIERRRPKSNPHEKKPDNRLVHLYLSEQGEAFIRESQVERCRATADLLSALPLNEARMIVEALERAMQAKQEEMNTPT
ncbi:MAG: MarR family transcriptional regulator [Chloroflexi bacterium]|nr:MarR family transcriptional regulator [Chloroflexota bacterium]